MLSGRGMALRGVAVFAAWALIAGVLCGVAFAEEEPVYRKAMGIALEEVDYPYPANFIRLHVNGELVNFEFMDVNYPSSNVVVLLHGKNFYGAYWHRVIGTLSLNGFRVIVPDQLGFGKSSKPDIDYNFKTMAQQTVWLAENLGVKKFAVMGHSMGGMLAVRLAVDFPERVTRVVLANPIGLEDYGEKVPPQSLDDLFNKELEDRDTKKLREFFKHYVVEWKPDIYERFVEMRARVAMSAEYPRWAKASARTYEMILRQPVRAEFGKIKAPTLLVIGQKDRTAVGKDLVSKEVAATMGNYPELGKAAARDIPNAKLVEIQEAAHIPFLEKPDEFFAAVAPFLKGGGE
jgi:pimeloyl-ACP methyl ester carboxylesterase